MEAAELDAKNGVTKWMDAISKEMTNVRVSFDILKGGDRAPIGHKQINYHLIFDFLWHSNSKFICLPHVYGLSFLD